MKTVPHIGANTAAPVSALGERFRRFSQHIARVAGSPWAFIAGVSVTLIWGFSGRYFGYSENWQLVINTGTTIITFLMVFVIQNTQSRDSKDLHVKLDELLRAVENARNTVINCADLSDEELEEMREEIHAQAPAVGNGHLVAPDGTSVARL
jgi:low affinity Fe/Cu permease